MEHSFGSLVTEISEVLALMLNLYFFSKAFLHHKIETNFIRDNKYSSGANSTFLMNQVLDRKTSRIYVVDVNMFSIFMEDHFVSFFFY